MDVQELIAMATCQNCSAELKNSGPKDPDIIAVGVCSKECATAISDDVPSSWGIGIFGTAD